MARYTCSYRVPQKQLNRSLAELLQGCECDMIYDTGDYLMARETPGKIAFTELVTVEVLIDSTQAENGEVQIHFVVKNEELPLQRNNHCQQMHKVIQSAIAERFEWKLVENAMN